MADARKMAGSENWRRLFRELSQRMCGERGRRPRLKAIFLLERQEPDIRAIYCRASTSALLSWTIVGTLLIHYIPVLQSTAVLVRQVGSISMTCVSWIPTARFAGSGSQMAPWGHPRRTKPTLLDSHGTMA